MPYNVNIVGWMPEGELKVIEYLASLVPEGGHIVEVGSMAGRSSVCFAMSCKPGVRVTCIDLFDSHTVVKHDMPQSAIERHNFPESGKVYDMHAEFTRNTADCKNISMIRGNSPLGVVYTNEPIDLFFLDAHHYNPSDWNNIVFYSKFVKVGGYICGHDYHKGEQFPDVVKNVKRLERIYGAPAITYPGSSIWCIPVNKQVDLSSF